MTTCLEFRRRVGAEPFADDAGVDAHRRECAACARHQDEMRAMDGLIQKALEVNPPARGTGRPRFFAIAASLVSGVAVALVVLVAAPRAAIAREVVGHVLHEPDATGSAARLPHAAVAAVLDPSGMQLRDGAGAVSFAARCEFEGHVVPHLVVQRPEGPVTVLVLAHRSISRPVRFSEQGYAGVVLPATRGAIAVIGQDVADIDAVAQQVLDAVDWGKQKR